MHLLDLMNRRAIGLGFVAYLVLLIAGVLIVGGDPSDTELQLIFWPAMAVGLAVATIVIFHDTPPDKDK